MGKLMRDLNLLSMSMLLTLNKLESVSIARRVNALSTIVGPSSWKKEWEK